MSRTKLKVELNREGVSQLLKSEQMQQVLKKYAERVRQKAGEGFKQEVKVGTKRARVNISADNAQMYYRNLKHNILLKALK